jgi:integrase
MKPRGQHPDKALSAVRVRAVAEPGRYADGNGLYLVVDPSGAKRWVLRTVVRGKRRDVGLGGLRLVSLAEAREQALAFRKLARNGGDPLAERRRHRRLIPTFEEAARSVHGEHSVAWRNAKHAAQWFSTLAQYVFPTIAGRRVDQIETPDILRVLAPIWLTKPETARRVRQRIGTILDWAKAAGFRDGENPVAGVAKGLPKQPDRKAHHAALPYAEVPGFVAALDEVDISWSARLAFEFVVLTATRTSEALAARWNEIDLDGETWTIPPERTKTARRHRVPLSRRCLEILADARELSCGSEYVFPGRSAGKPLSNMALLMTLRRMGLNVTAHGFRSSFRDWASEQTSFPREVCELALGHSVTNKTEAAYRRGDLFDKRRDLMTAWARFASSAPADVVPIRVTKKAERQSNYA